MTNFEKYKEEIEADIFKVVNESSITGVQGMLCDWNKKAGKQMLGEKFSCDIGCPTCRTLFQLWLQRDVEDCPTVDWTKVKVDTPIYVSINKEDWFPRYFSHYEDGKIYAFCDGKTSFSVEDYDLIEDGTTDWPYAKIVED